MSTDKKQQVGKANPQDSTAQPNKVQSGSTVTEVLNANGLGDAALNALLPSNGVVFREDLIRPDILKSLVDKVTLSEKEIGKSKATDLILSGFTNRADLATALAIQVRLNEIFPPQSSLPELTPQTFDALLQQGIRNIQRKSCEIETVSPKRIQNLDTEIRSYITSVLKVPIKWLRKYGAEVSYEIE